MAKAATRPGLRRSALALILAALHALGAWSAPAHAEPSDDPCAATLVSIMCRFIPMAPDLSTDVDLTKDVPRVPAEIAESQVSEDICSMGCS